MITVEQLRWTGGNGLEGTFSQEMEERGRLVLVFGSPSALEAEGPVDEILARFPAAQILGCSTAGEIHDTEVLDDTLVVTAVSFEHTEVRGAKVRIEEYEDGYRAGRMLAGALEKEDLIHVFVLSDGLKINGSELVRGLVQELPEGVTITGGLSGDGDRFSRTVVLFNGRAEADSVAAVGFYGSRLTVGFGSMGGWDSFGPDRLITRSEGPVLFELDGQSALQLYKKYLGKHASGLPATALLFPLALRSQGSDSRLVRTVLSVSEEAQSMTFAGDMPEGSYARLMKANFDRLIDGAMGAAEVIRGDGSGVAPSLAVLISCVGRKMVLRQRIEEEVEGVREVLGEKTSLTGFYSYGEISPAAKGSPCELHNQTMTITTLFES